jgi:hypothetical protein
MQYPMSLTAELIAMVGKTMPGWAKYAPPIQNGRFEATRR